MKIRNKWNKFLLGTGLFTLLVFLSGCVSTYTSGPKKGQPIESGLIYQFLVKPMSDAINFFVHQYDWNYGWAIIAITVLVRIFIILPLGIYQSKKSMEHSEKLSRLQPQLKLAQKKAKEAQSTDEQMEANRLMQAVYKENGVSMTGGMGCLPLLVQMPFFTALYFAAQYTPGLNKGVFFGIPLGEPSKLLLVLVGAIFLIQGMFSLIGIPEEQKKVMRTSVFMSPIFIVFVSLKAPAGVDLYWIVGGIFGCIQSLITNLYYRPKITKKIDAELDKHPLKVVVTEESFAKPTVQTTKKQKNNTTQKNSNKQRNSGKQNR